MCVANESGYRIEDITGASEINKKYREHCINAGI
jgi:hypothetical protein